MRLFRLMFALLLATSLAILPISPAATLTHAAKAEMAMAADDCPCCKTGQPDSCPLKCCHLQAIAVEGVKIARPSAARFVVYDAPVATPVPRRPELPPPRV
jgi:hypothetical protein